MTESVEGRVGYHQQMVPIFRSALVVGSPGGLKGPETSVQRNGHLESLGPVLFDPVPFQKKTGFGKVMHQKTSQIPSRIAAPPIAKIDDSDDLAFIHQYMGGIEFAMQKMPDWTQFVVVGMVGHRLIDTVHFGIVDHSAGPKRRKSEIKDLVEKVPPGVVFPLNLSCAEIGRLLQQPKSGHTNFVYGPDSPSGLANQSMTIIDPQVDLIEGNPGEFFDDYEVAGIGFPPEVGGQHPWYRCAKFSGTLVSPGFENDPTLADFSIGLEEHRAVTEHGFEDFLAIP